MPLTMLIDLPNEVLVEVFSFLSYTDIIRCSRTCKRLHMTSRTERLWKQLCSTYGLIYTCPDNITWRDCFVQWFKEFGRYRDVYRQIKLAWTKIEVFTRENCPIIFESLKGGLSERDIAAFESTIRTPLPLDLRCCYRLHDGQELCHSAGLFGTMVTEKHRSEYLFSLHWAIPAACFYKDTDPSWLGCLPITFCPTMRVGQMVALEELKGLAKGTVFYPSGDHSFLTGESFSKWFCRYADQLESNLYPVIEGEIYKFYKNPDWEVVCDNISVTVSGCFLPENTFIKPPTFYFFHAFRISMSMGKSASPLESCRLEICNLLVTDEDGNEDKKTAFHMNESHQTNAVLNPGTSFSWSYNLVLSTSCGSMVGLFNLKNLSTGCSFTIQSPTLHLKSLPYQDRCERPVTTTQESSSSTV